MVGELAQRAGEVTVGTGNPGAQSQGHRQGIAVQGLAEGHLAASAAIDLAEHPLQVAGHQHEAPIADQSATRLQGDFAQGAPGQATPAAAEADPHPLAVGDQERGAGIDEGAEVDDGEGAEHGSQHPVERSAAAGGPAQVGDRHGRRTGPHDGGEAGVAAYLHEFGRGRQWLRLGFGVVV